MKVLTIVAKFSGYV